MKPKTILAIVLIVMGVITFAYQGISYTTREKAVDLGPIQVTAEKTHTLPLPPLIGAVSLGVGILLLVTGGRRA